MDNWEILESKDLDKTHKAFISVHSFVNRESLGGTRFMEYDNEDLAKSDAFMLSRAMTYKARAAGINTGGGKAVISGKIPKNSLEKQKILRKFSKFLNEFNGQKNKKGIFKTGADVGIYPQDVLYMKKFTKYVHGFPIEEGGIGDLGLATAKGVIRGIEYLSEKILHKNVNECTIGIQGLGQVGFPICEYFLKKGCKVKVNDIVREKVVKAKKIGAEFTKEPWNEEIFVPCAIGGIIDEKFARKCKAKIICGGANNQLLNNSAGRILQKRKIFFTPDYAVNLGGVVLVYYEDLKKTFQEAEEHITKKVLENLKKFTQDWPKQRPEIIARKLFEK